MDEIAYENRTCVFIDILGWKEVINTCSIEIIYKLLNPFLNISSQYQQRKQRENARPENESSPYPYEVQLTAFSDSLVMSMPTADLIRIFSNLPKLITAFLERGILIRGGIYIGKLYHQDNVIFGPALNKAYQIESEEAIFPRILIADEVIEDFSHDIPEIKQLPEIMKDHLNNWVINPFPCHSSGDMRAYLNINFSLETVIDSIDRKIKSQKNSKIRNKWIYQAELCAKSLEKVNFNFLI
ncbi:hypothetical protein ACD661_11760 [Legionella lytica]|uniref:Guanylate cyclase domain-containing protein n=1 Tax=Legionella lytica TaxID=96232 RepID=A0ABW8D951_9GAMM